ncbi:MAG: CRISPR-associated protein Csx16 [Pseudomonadota bacterium]
MTVYFVSRHDGALRWARILQKQAVLPFDIDEYVPHIDPEQLHKGDVVIGTLPLREVQRLREQGVRFLNLDLQVPPDMRGQELTATQMTACGATLTEYRVTVKETFELDPLRKKRGRASGSPRPAVTIMLVSQEIMPQFLGFLHVPTPEVILIVTQSMARRADQLKALLQNAPQAPKVQGLPLDEAVGYLALRAYADSRMDELLSENRERIVVNLTGGTKLMSLAFGDASRTALREHDQLDILYVDTAQGRLEFLNRAAPENMLAVLGVADAVLASGKADAGCASAAPLFRKQMLRTPVHNALLRGDQSIIAALNSMSMDMESLRKGQKSEKLKWFDTQASSPKQGLFVMKKEVDPSIKFLRQRLEGALAGALGRSLHQHDVLIEPPTRTENGLSLRLTRPSEIDYLKGGWLEAHIASIIEKAKPDDWACGVQIGSEAGKNNEIDAIVTCGNRTLLIEIKTANLARESSQDDGEKSTKGQDTIYKLDSVGHELARNFNDNWLVSVRLLDQADRDRAEDKRITVFAPKESKEPASQAIADFEQRLHAWIAQHRQKAAVDATHPHRPLAVSAEWEKRQKQDDKAAYGAGKRIGQQSASEAPARGGLNDQAMGALAKLKAEMSAS